MFALYALILLCVFYIILIQKSQVRNSCANWGIILFAYFKCNYAFHLINTIIQYLKPFGWLKSVLRASKIDAIAEPWDEDLSYKTRGRWRCNRNLALRQAGFCLIKQMSKTGSVKSLEKEIIFFVKKITLACN